MSKAELLLASAVLLLFADAATTYILVGHLGGFEANPVFRDVNEAPGKVFLYALAEAPAPVAAYLIWRRMPAYAKAAFFTLLFFALVRALAVANNVLQMLTSIFTPSAVDTAASS